MRSYPSATLLHMEDTLEVRGQLKKCFNMDFYGLAYSRILIDVFKIMMDVREWASS